MLICVLYHFIHMYHLSILLHCFLLYVFPLTCSLWNISCYEDLQMLPPFYYFVIKYLENYLVLLLFFVYTVDSETIGCNYHCDFVNFDRIVIQIFSMLKRNPKVFTKNIQNPCFTNCYHVSCKFFANIKM